MPDEEHPEWHPHTLVSKLQSTANPRNWSKPRKCLVAINISLLVFCVNFTAASIVPAIDAIAEHMNASREITTLSVSLFVLGFALGPLVWAPLSEHVGRIIPLFAGMLIYILLQIPIACTKDIGVLIACRLLAGMFGSVAISIPPGQAADTFAPEDRGPAVALYLLMVFLGPLVGPVAGIYLLRYKWQWTVWTGMIMSATVFVLCLFTVAETSERVLQRKNKVAKPIDIKHSRFTEKDLVQIEAKPYDTKQCSVWRTYLRYFSRPFHLACTEPILLSLTIHTSLAYAVIYLSFFAIPYSFEVKRRWHPTGAYLSLLAMAVGIFVGFLILSLYNQVWCRKRLAALEGLQREQKLTPSQMHASKLRLHLPLLMLGSLMLPAGFFWFAWSIASNIHWMLPMSAVTFIGVAVMLIYAAGLSFLVDRYSVGDLTNSALAVAACGRALLSASFPLFVLQMYEELGVAWAGSLLGFLCCPLGLIPLLLWWRISQDDEA